MISKKISFISIGIVLISLTYLVLASSPYKGSLHQHTGFSAGLGYDGSIGGGDGCLPPLEGHPFEGTNVTELRDQALNLGLDYLGFSDHSYCIDEDEFSIVETDCIDTRNSTFTCLVGEELSTSDVSGDNEEDLFFCEGDLGEAHIGAYGLNNFLPSYPSASHCPVDPTSQAGINRINLQNGISVLNHPHPETNEFLDFDFVPLNTGSRTIIANVSVV